MDIVSQPWFQSIFLILQEVSSSPTYLMIGKSNVTGENGSYPVTAQFDINALSQLLKGGQVVGLEVVSQGYMKLLLVRFHVHIYKKENCGQLHAIENSRKSNWSSISFRVMDDQMLPDVTKQKANIKISFFL